MSGHVVNGVVAGEKQSIHELTRESIISGSASQLTLISGTRAPQGAETVLDPREGLAAFRGIAWSFVFEGAAAALCYSAYQLWKFLR